MVDVCITYTAGLVHATIIRNLNKKNIPLTTKKFLNLFKLVLSIETPTHPSRRASYYSPLTSKVQVSNTIIPDGVAISVLSKETSWEILL